MYSALLLALSKTRMMFIWVDALDESQKPENLSGLVSMEACRGSDNNHAIPQSSDAITLIL